MGTLKDLTLSILSQYHLTPNPKLDQFFLVDDKVVWEIIKLADIKPGDKILEIGSGLGNLTRELAKFPASIISIEIDQKFTPILSQLPKNVVVKYDKAWDLTGREHGPDQHYDLIISNIPYRLTESFMHKFTNKHISKENRYEFRKMILVMSKSGAEKLVNNFLFKAYYDMKIVADILPISFYPDPGITSSMMEIRHRVDLFNSDDPSTSARRFVYQHENQLVKNALRLFVEDWYFKKHQQKLTKNEARKIVNSWYIGENLLNSLPVSDKIYQAIAQKVIAATL